MFKPSTFEPSTSSSQVINALLTHLNGNERLLKLVHGWNRSVLFAIDGQRFRLQAADDGMRLVPDTGTDADINFTMNHQTLLRIAREEVTPLAAKMSGDITSTGSLIQILKFASILSTTIRDYRETGSS